MRNGQNGIEEFSFLHLSKVIFVVWCPKEMKDFCCLFLFALFLKLGLGNKRDRVIEVGTTLGPNFHRKEGKRKFKFQIVPT